MINTKNKENSAFFHLEGVVSQLYTTSFSDYESARAGDPRIVYKFSKETLIKSLVLAPVGVLLAGNSKVRVAFLIGRDEYPRFPYFNHNDLSISKYLTNLNGWSAYMLNSFTETRIVINRIVSVDEWFYAKVYSLVSTADLFGFNLQINYTELDERPSDIPK